MRLKLQYCVLCSALTLAAACSDDAPAPVNVAGSAGAAGAAAAGASSGGNPAAGTGSGGSSAGMAGMTQAGGGKAGGAGGVGGAAGAAGAGGAGGAPAVAVCGNGMKEGAEGCDDGDEDASDGCSATCSVEAGYVCNTPGQACTPICGDGVLIAPETCDDKNTASSDGCSNTCKLEDGWECKTVGQACTGICGDGILADELCDDNNVAPNDGCSATCVPQIGYVCDVPGKACRKAPDCSGGVCTSICGDGLVIGEACDDGNNANNDGCSATCLQETGYTCETVEPKPADLPAQLALSVTYRDFVGAVAGGSTKHPDYQAFNGLGITPGMVGALLGGDGLPVYTAVCEAGGPNLADTTKCPFNAQSTSEANFNQWYRDTEGVNLTRPGVVRLDQVGQSGAYVFDGGQTFTPLTGKGWDAEGKEALTEGKNFGFTTELRYFFAYQGDEMLDFSGDDDVWVFINGRLAVDIGGLHPKQTKSVTLNVQTSAALGNLTIGNVYELALFHAERSPAESNFKLTLKGFLSKTSKCTQN